MPTAVLEQDDKGTFRRLEIGVADTLDVERNVKAQDWSKIVASERTTISRELDAVLPKPAMKPKRDPLEVLESPSEEASVEKDFAPLIRLSSGQTSPRQFRMLQQWEGIISEVGSDSVWAELRDLTDGTKSPEVVELGLDEISEADRPLLEPGSVFYWSIGYEQTRGGQRRRISEVRVRRTPEWSQHAIDQLKRKAAEMLRQFGGDCEHNPTAES